MSSIKKKPQISKTDIHLLKKSHARLVPVTMELMAAMHDVDFSMLPKPIIKRLKDAFDRADDALSLSEKVIT